MLAGVVRDEPHRLVAGGDDQRGPEAVVELDVGEHVVGGVPGRYDGGGGGPASVIRVTTGTSNTIASLGNTRTVVRWMSATAGAKTQNIPSAATITPPRSRTRRNC